MLAKSTELWIWAHLDTSYLLDSDLEHVSQPLNVICKMYMRISPLKSLKREEMHYQWLVAIFIIKWK